MNPRRAIDSLESFAYAPPAPAGALREELTKWRKRSAGDRNVKAVSIITNKSLEAIAAEIPTSTAELSSLQGMNRGKVSEYGAEILAICQRFKNTMPAPMSAPPAAGMRPPATPQVAPAQWGQQEHAWPGGTVDYGPPPKRMRTGAAATADAPPAAQPQGPAGPKEALDRSMLTPEQARAADRALRGESIFVTGAAGTGKSFLLRYIIQELEKRHPGEVAITAPTGIAAINIGGQTIHSFSGVGMMGDKLKEVARPDRYLLARIRNVESVSSRWRDSRVLVIDEISMLEPDLFEMLDMIGREIRGNRAGFGGLQLLLCGDFLQLPPVEADRNESASRWSFCFETPAWQRCQLKKGTVILQQAVRQSGDPGFVQLLNLVRAGQCTPRVQELCGQCLVSAKPRPNNGIIPTRLYCTNRDVDQENNRELAALRGAATLFTSSDHFAPNRGSGSSKTSQNDKRKLLDLLNRTVPHELKLKVHAQVILLKRLKAYGLVNGSRGFVTELHDNAATVKFDNGSTVKVERERFQNSTASTVGHRQQLPLKLGWALTVHKSQGMTISNAEVHLDDAFSCGQAYVALSRLTGFAGLWIGGRGISQHNIRAHPKALAFYGMT